MSQAISASEQPPLSPAGVIRRERILQQVLQAADARQRRRRIRQGLCGVSLVCGGLLVWCLGPTGGGGRWERPVPSRGIAAGRPAFRALTASPSGAVVTPPSRPPFAVEVWQPGRGASSRLDIALLPVTRSAEAYLLPAEVTELPAAIADEELLEAMPSFALARSDERTILVSRRRDRPGWTVE